MKCPKCLQRVIRRPKGRKLPSTAYECPVCNIVFRDGKPYDVFHNSYGAVRRMEKALNVESTHKWEIKKCELKVIYDTALTCKGMTIDERHIMERVVINLDELRKEITQEVDKI